MAEIPDIVRSRLRQPAGQPNAHPDANLLAAFAEQSLAPREREAVIAHLAQCAECRESLAVAFRAQEPEPAAADATAMARPVRRWFPAWRWVAPAAVACCIVAVALQYHVFPTHQQSASAPVARSVASAPPASEPAVGVVAVNKTEPRAPAPADQPRQAAKKSALRKFSPPRASAEVATAALPPNPELVAPSPQASAAAALLEPQEHKELAKAGRVAPAAAGVTGASPPTATPGFLAAQSRNSYARAKQAAPRMVTRAAASLQQAPSGVRWSINASPDAAGNTRGVVQRSEDAGSTWQVAPISESVSFFAVASAGPHVWAGGSEGALFHSSDGGSHWDQIIVTEGQAKLTGAIVHIDAVSPSLVRITTSTGEHWTSADGGRSWRQQ